MLWCPASMESQLRSQHEALQLVFGFKAGGRGHPNHPAIFALLSGCIFSMLFSIHQNAVLGEWIHCAVLEPPQHSLQPGRAAASPPWLSARRMLGLDCPSGSGDRPLLDTLVPILDAGNIYVLSTSPACSDQITVYIPG